LGLAVGVLHLVTNKFFSTQELQMKGITGSKDDRNKLALGTTHLEPALASWRNNGEAGLAALCHTVVQPARIEPTLSCVISAAVDVRDLQALKNMRTRLLPCRQQSA